MFLIWFDRRTDDLKFGGLNKVMANADTKVEVAAAMKSYLTSQDFKDIIVKSVKEAVGQAVESILKELKAEIAVLEGELKPWKTLSRRWPRRRTIMNSFPAVKMWGLRVSSKKKKKIVHRSSWIYAGRKLVRT